MAIFNILYTISTKNKEQQTFVDSWLVIHKDIHFLPFLVDKNPANPLWEL